MDQLSLSQSNRQSRRLQTAQPPVPSLFTKSLHLTDPLPTIVTLDASSSSYPNQTAISSVHNPAPYVEDELHSESEGQQGSARQESGEGGTTSDFVKKLYRCVFRPQF